MESSAIRKSELLTQLLSRRDSIFENELCRLIRGAAEADKLATVELIGEKNVKLAAVVAVRVGLSVDQQKILLKRVLARGGSNEVKQYVLKLFCCRFGARNLSKELGDCFDVYPKSVWFSAYYARASTHFSGTQKRLFLKFLERPRSAEKPVGAMLG